MAWTFVTAAQVASGKPITTNIGEALRANQELLRDSLTFGQCRLTKSGVNLLLSRQDGRFLIIDGNLEEIPSAGVTLAPAGAAADTTYFIYAWMDAGVMKLEFSATAHATDATSGLEIKTADATRTLVGQARAITGPAWVDTPAQRFVISYFNRRSIVGINPLNTTTTTTSTSEAELDTGMRCSFLTWADEAVIMDFVGRASNNGAGNETYSTIGIDDTTAEDAVNAFMPSTAGYFYPVAVHLNPTVSEGYHYGTPLGRVSAGTGSWHGGAGAGARCTFTIVIRG